MERGAGASLQGGVEVVRLDALMTEQFVSAAIQPIGETLDPLRMSKGEPGLPRQFRWRGRTIRIAQVLATWRETGPCHHGSGETLRSQALVRGANRRGRDYENLF